MFIQSWLHEAKSWLTRDRRTVRRHRPRTTVACAVEVLDARVVLSAAPAAPSKFFAEAIASDEVELSWKDVKNERGYRIYMNDGSGWEQVDSIRPNATSYTVMDLEADTRYSFRVEAYNSAGAKRSRMVTVTTPIDPPLAPEGLLATAVSESEVELSWDDTENEDGYLIYALIENDWELIGSISADVTGCLVTDLEADTEYMFYVEAFNSAGSDFTDAVSATTDGSATPSPAQNLTQMKRAYNPNDNFTVYTSQPAEFDALVRAGYQDQSVWHAGWDVLTAPQPGAVPVHRLYNPNTAQYFLTLDSRESSRLTSQGWKAKPDVGWAFPKSAKAAGTTEVFTLHNKQNGDHVYTTDVTERDVLLLQSDTWERQASLGFAYNAQPTSTTAINLPPGTVTSTINQQLLEAIGELRQEAEELQAEAGDLVDVSPYLDQLDELNSQITQQQEELQPLVDGRVSQLQLGPHLVLTAEAVASGERLLVDKLQELSGSSVGSGGIDSIEDVRRLGEEFYTRLVEDTIAGSREAVNALSGMLMEFSGFLYPVMQGTLTLTLAGISAALESGTAMLHDRNATRADYRQTIDQLGQFVEFGALGNGIELLKNGNSELAKIADWGVRLQTLAETAQTFNRSQPGSLGSQIDQNFGQIQQKLATNPTHNTQWKLWRIYGGKEEFLGTFNSLDEANASWNAWSNAHPGNLSLNRIDRYVDGVRQVI